MALRITIALDAKLHFFWILRGSMRLWWHIAGTIADISAGLIIMLSRNFTKNGWSAFLNSLPMDFIGKLSYSLYIWQEIFFMYPQNAAFIINISLISVTSLVSYYFLEKPFLKLREKIQRRMSSKKRGFIRAGK